MTPQFDAIIVGGGHNGLTCGAYLARAGVKVLVVERREIIGGAAITRAMMSVVPPAAKGTSNLMGLVG